MTDPTLLMVSSAVLAAIVLVLAFALAAAAKGAERGRRRNPLSALSDVRSPSGKPFFPTAQSVTELATLLNGIHELAPYASAPPQRTSVSDPRRRPPRVAVTPRPAR